MELQAMEIWIAFITLVLAPIIYGMRENANENKRIDVLLNKTREEVARDYVTKEELENNLKQKHFENFEYNEKLYLGMSIL